MKTARTVLRFASDSVEIFGQYIPLQFTSSGHYICLKDYMKQDHQVLLNFISSAKGGDQNKIARKLHLQF